MDAKQAELVLYRALETSFGIVVETNNVEGLRKRLQQVRRELADTDTGKLLAVLTFRPSPTKPDTQLWIIKQEASDAPTEG